MLRSGTDIEDFAAEVAPLGGLAFIFRVQANSWHGHKPFVGPRRYVMLNYCTDMESRDREVARHRWSDRVKKFERLFGIGRILRRLEPRDWPCAAIRSRSSKQCSTPAIRPEGAQKLRRISGSGVGARSRKASRVPPRRPEAPPASTRRGVQNLSGRGRTGPAAAMRYRPCNSTATPFGSTRKIWRRPVPGWRVGGE